MNLDIYIPTLLKDDEKSLGGGGIGTLAGYLLPLVAEMGFSTSVYQCSKRAYETTYEKAKVYGVPLWPGRDLPTEKIVSHWRQLARQRYGKGDRIELFMADFFSVRNENPLAIVVQNGIAWDAPINILTQKKLFQTPLGERVFRMSRQLRGLKRVENCYNRVAADLYFLNWYRSFRGIDYQGRIWYNPNPAPPRAWDPRRESPSKEVRIIFARRFFPEKGTRLIAAVFKRLLRERPATRITLAGDDGPERPFLEKEFASDKRVEILTYEMRDALDVHARHDIAVVPSICGEATSLSIVEAMAAGCAVVATNLGGTITQIIHGYNGLLCSPLEEEIHQNMLFLVDNPAERLRLQKTGWETAQQAFSLSSWRERWRKILTETIDGKSEAEQKIKHQLRFL